MSDLVTSPDVHPGNGAPPPFVPGPHSMALRRGIAVLLHRSQNVEAMKMHPMKGVQIGFVLDNQREMMLTLAHLCDAVIAMGGEPREIRFGERPAEESGPKLVES